jgi:hypothetical protein
MKPSLDRERHLFDALKRITKYMSPDELRRISERKYGLDGDEAIEMAYDNVLNDARTAMGIYACPRCGNPNGWWSGNMRDVHDCPGPPRRQWPGQPAELDLSELDDKKPADGVGIPLEGGDG